MTNFKADLIHILLNSLFSRFNDNYDFYRFGKKKTPTIIGEVLRKFKLYVTYYINIPDFWVLGQWLSMTSKMDWLYSKLEDEESRELLLNVIAYRIMGHKAIKLPLNTRDYWEKLDHFQKLQEGSDTVNMEFRAWKLCLTDLAVIDLPFKMYTRPSGMMMLHVKQYSCARAGIVVNKNDVVLDCGGCYGDTALDFSWQVGEEGKVYTFEFVSSNLAIMNKNLALNPSLEKCIEIVQKPLWGDSDTLAFIEENGPASRISFDANSIQNPSKTIQTISIDDFISREKLDRVNLIKMDIEGAEFDVLKGAEQTIRKFKPNLALSIYHIPKHFYQLAQYIDGLDLGYRFYIGHFTIYEGETVLFAKAS